MAILIVWGAIATAIIYGLFQTYNDHIKAKQNSFLANFDSSNMVMQRLKC